jgi:hypothetical protein
MARLSRTDLAVIRVFLRQIFFDMKIEVDQFFQPWG